MKLLSSALFVALLVSAITSSAKAEWEDRTIGAGGPIVRIENGMVIRVNGMPVPPTPLDVFLGQPAPSAQPQPAPQVQAQSQPAQIIVVEQPRCCHHREIRSYRRVTTYATVHSSVTLRMTLGGNNHHDRRDDHRDKRRKSDC